MQYGYRKNSDEKAKEIKGSDAIEEKRAEDGIDDDNKYKKKKNAEKLSTWLSLVVLAFCFGVFGLVLLMDGRLPKPLTIADAENQPEKFIEERARDHLRQITSVGPRPAGSYENEVLAVDFIRRRLESIQKRTKSVHNFMIDVQKPRGSFNLQFVDGLTQNYRDITNIIVKFEPTQQVAKDALLVNCHFDSVPQSPGASDDAVSCAIMLEVLEVLSQSDQPLRNSLIFLFNGAEENLLPASHGFITQHKWARDARAFINLEACGSGGRELVFQSGPGHSWLIEAYANAAPHPFASVIGQEIFQSGVIPGDTDFRIFRDYGKIPGLDIAYVKNGYIYHTKYDTEDRIPSGSIQRAGDNVLAVVKHLGDSDVLTHTEASNKGSIVFFDLLGFCLIYYPEWLGILINVIVVIVSVGITANKAINSFQYGVTTKNYLRQLGYTLLIQIMGCVASFAVVTFIALLLDATGTLLMVHLGKIVHVFFSREDNVVVCKAMANFLSLYGAHCDGCDCSLLLCTSQAKEGMKLDELTMNLHYLVSFFQYFQFADGVWVIESLYFEVSKLVWTLYTLVMTFLGLKSSFFCMIWVLFPMIGRLVLEKMYDRTAVQRRPKDWKWLVIHLFSLAIPLIMMMYLIYMTFLMFIPIMGRSGSFLNPDLIIGYKAASMTLATLSFICPLFMVMHRPPAVMTTLYMVTFFSVILVVTTRLGFPYSASPSNLAPHRSLIVHTAREFYNRTGEKFKDDSGYFVINLDRNSPSVLYHWVPEYYTMKEISDKECQKYLYCGVPVYYPCSSMLRINNWIPAPKPKIFRDTNITLLHADEVAPHVVRLLFQASGPDHMGIFFSPVTGVKLNTWSFSDGEVLEGPSWKDDRPTHYIFYSHGLSPSPWQFWLEFKVIFF